MKNGLKKVLAALLTVILLSGGLRFLYAEGEESEGACVSAELAAGDSITYTVSGDLTGADASALDTSVVTVSLSKKDIEPDTGSYYLYYTSGGSTYYFTFSVSSGSLSVGTASSKDSATALTYAADYSLSFTSEDTTYYINNNSGITLSADSSSSTQWSYDASSGFYCTVSGTVYYLAALTGYTTSSTSPASAAPSGTTLVSYAQGSSSGVYTLSFTENDEIKYLILSYDSSETGNLKTTVTTNASEATQITFDGTSLTFNVTETSAAEDEEEEDTDESSADTDETEDTSESEETADEDASEEETAETTTTTTYYLDINPNGGSGYIVAQTSETRTSSTTYNAAWLYDPDCGFFCRKSYTFYLKISSETSGSETSYSLVLSQSSSNETNKSLLTANAAADITFYLTYGSYYLALGSGTDTLTSVTTSKSGATELTLTTAGNLCFKEDRTTYYLKLESGGGLGTTSDKDEATKVAYKLANGSAWAYGFTFTSSAEGEDGQTTESENLYLCAGTVLAESDQTEITFTGVSAGETSVTIGGATYNITVYTDIITIYAGDSYVASIEGTYTEDNLTWADSGSESSSSSSNFASASFATSAVGYTDASVNADGTGDYVLGYSVSGITFYFIFDLDGTSLTAGTTTYYYDGTALKYTTDKYLSFTQDGTTYYLNVSDGALCASTSAATAWEYDTTNGFTVSTSGSSDDSDSSSEDSSATLLDMLATLDPSSQVLTPVYSFSSGSYTLTYTDSNSTSQYLAFSVSEGILSVTAQTDSSSGTALTYTTGGTLSFTQDETEYYLYVDENGNLAASSDSENAAAWSYDPENGFSCTVSGTVYYLSGTGVSSSSGTNAVTFSSATDLSLALGYESGSLTHYVLFTSYGYAGQLSTTLSETQAKVTYTSSGYLKNNYNYYLNLSGGKISVSTDASTAWSFDPEEGFYYADEDGNIWYLSDFMVFTSNTSASAILGHGQTTGKGATAITFTGVSAGTTIATVTSEGSESTKYVYKIIVLDSSGYVTSSTSPFIGSSITTTTKNASSYATVTAAGYAGKAITGLYLSKGLSYAIALNTSSGSSTSAAAASSGGTWTIADSSVATFDSENITVNTNGSVSLSDTDTTSSTVTLIGISEGTTTLTYTATDGISYTIPVTIADYWGYSSSDSTSIKVYEFYITEVTDTSAYMAVLYGSSNASVSSTDFTKITEGEVVYLSFPYNSATAVDFFGTPDEGYALTLLGSTNSAGHYMTLDADSPGETEFISLVTAAGYNQVYYYDSAAVFDVTQAALDYGADGGMGFTRQASSYGNVSSEITVRSQKLPTITKEVTSITKSDGTTVSYSSDTQVSVGDTINYTITITQYQTTEEISYTAELLTDSLYEGTTLLAGYGSSSSSLLTFKDSDGASSQEDSVSETDSSSDAQATVSNLNLSNTTLSENRTYTYTVSYTVTSSDQGKTLTNTASFTYSYQSQYSSSGQSGAMSASVTLSEEIKEEETTTAQETTQGSTKATEEETADDTDDSSASTGDEGNLIFWAALLIFAAILLAALGIKRKIGAGKK